MVCPDVHGHLNLCLKGVRKKKTVRRMIRKKIGGRRRGPWIRQSSNQQHAASWATLPHPTPSWAFVGEKKQYNNLLSASKLFLFFLNQRPTLWAHESEKQWPCGRQISLAIFVCMWPDHTGLKTKFTCTGTPVSKVSCEKNGSGFCFL